MLRIRKITDTRAKADRVATEQAMDILRSQFPDMAERDIAKLPAQLRDPFEYSFISELFVAEDGRGKLRGMAVVLFDPTLLFAYLEVVSAAPGGTGGGIGAALYERVREESAAHGAEGLYFECLPDEEALSPDPATRAQNAARLKFYERYAAFPIVGTLYETPMTDGDTDAPFLLFDGLGSHPLPTGERAERLAEIVRAILERKYSHLCPPEYNERVVASMTGPQVGLRAPRYVRQGADGAVAKRGHGPIPLIVNDKHDIHHVRERGYVEAPVRIPAILDQLLPSGLFERREPRRYADRWIRQVHDGRLIDYLRRACAEAPEGRAVYPYVFPLRNRSRPPKERSALAGYWCMDTFTPLNPNAWPAARGAADCALTAADAVLGGAPLAYALVRPPGHHAERSAYGGFCYLNNTAVAAQLLSHHGRVAVLDVDYHHGNGTQDIFYERSDVLTVSVHGHPRFAYPYFAGFADERGKGPGAGYNLNLPLDEDATPQQHRDAVGAAMRRIARHRPTFLVLALGLDTAKGDPTGTWSNRAADFQALGGIVGGSGLPTVVVQEGGYRARSLGTNARAFFEGLVDAQRSRPVVAPPPAPARGDGALSYRFAVRASDRDAVRRLVIATEMFNAEELDVSAELVDERVTRGAASGYEFVLAEQDGEVVGYACYGRTSGTVSAWDLYWIVVDPTVQSKGIGRGLLARVEEALAPSGPAQLYIDTSSKAEYEPTRAFYRRTGFETVADIDDFYGPGDGKVVMRKDLGGVDA